MFGALKRVISDPDQVGNSKEGKISKTDVHDSSVMANETSATPSINLINDGNISTERNMDAPPAVVECDDRVEKEATASNSGNQHTSMSTASSVSDHSEERDRVEDGLMDEEAGEMGTPSHTPAGGLFHHESPLSRPDSRLSTDSLASIKTGGASSRDASGNWGWFEDVHGADGSPYDMLKNRRKDSDDRKTGGRNKRSSLLHYAAAVEPLNDMMPRHIDSAMAVTAPTYVLEESLSSQKLWKDTAGNRPPQPVEERAFYEKMWAQNFERSQVNYRMPVEVLTASSPISLSPFADGNFDEGARRSELSSYTLPSGDDSGSKGGGAHLATATLIDRLHDPTRPNEYQSVEVGGTTHKLRTVKGTESEGDLTVLVKGDNVFGTTVSKSFALDDKGGAVSGVDTVNISVASYRVVESKKYGKYAQFLVIYREGSIRDTVGVWKRYSDFVELSRKVTASHEGCSSVLANMSPLSITEEQEVEHLPNAITSWRLLKKRQRWYRCLDAGYLSLKVFLLERFLHDILFESTSPKILRDFALGP